MSIHVQWFGLSTEATSRASLVATKGHISCNSDSGKEYTTAQTPTESRLGQTAANFAEIILFLLREWEDDFVACAVQVYEETVDSIVPSLLVILSEPFGEDFVVSI